MINIDIMLINIMITKMTFKKKLKLTSLMYVGTKKKYSKKSTDSMGNIDSV